MDKYGIADPSIAQADLDTCQLNFEYRLIGVVIHSGIADAGHYYSLINVEKYKKAGQWDGTRRMTWQEFNDSAVNSYAVISNFNSDCFGQDGGAFTYGAEWGADFASQ